MTVQKVHNEKEWDEAIGEAKGLLLIAFHMVWCRPCRLMTPTIEKIAETEKSLRIVVVVDTDETEELREPFFITGTPTYILFCDGRERGRIVGYHDEETFRRKLRNLIKGETTAP